MLTKEYDHFLLCKIHNFLLLLPARHIKDALKVDKSPELLGTVS